jgi:histidinol-phosphatase (PHP family)
LIDTHVHTRNFSKDSLLDIEDLLLHSKNDSTLQFCITEHYDYGYYKPESALKVDLSDYSHWFMNRKNNFELSTGHPFPILLGIEYGYLKHLSSFYNCVSELIHFDSVVCSVHCIDGLDPYLERKIYNRGKEYVYRTYLETISEMIRTCEGFDIVGHFDYISRYAPYPDKILRYSDFPNQFDEIFSLCISKGKSLEFNTKSSALNSREMGNLVLFDADILKRYHELGGRNITLGSDAHSEDSLFCLFAESSLLFKQVGFDSLTYYKKRKPISIPI